MSDVHIQENTGEASEDVQKTPYATTGSAAKPRVAGSLHLHTANTPELQFLASGGIAPQRRRLHFHPRQLWVWRHAKFLMITLAVIVVTFAFIGEAAVVPTGSMEGTILIGDHLIVDKIMYGPRIPFTPWRLPMFKSIHRSNIIAFQYPRDPSLNFLKRVVALGGDKVEIRKDVLYIDDVPVAEPYVVHRARAGQSEAEDMPARIIPAGNLFVLGDNRDNSDDSRYWGTVPVENVIGSPLMVLWSYDAPSREWLDDDPAREIKFFASIVANLFTRTRWSRTGVLL